MTFDPRDVRTLWRARAYDAAKTPAEWRAWARRRRWRSSNAPRIAAKALTTGAMTSPAYVLNADDSVTRVAFDGERVTTKTLFSEG